MLSAFGNVKTPVATATTAARRDAVGFPPRLVQTPLDLPGNAQAPIEECAQFPI